MLKAGYATYKKVDIGWCMDRWCYVDPCGCLADETAMAETNMFAPAKLFYSYATCCGTIRRQGDCVYGRGGGECKWDEVYRQCVSSKTAEDYSAEHCGSKDSRDWCNQFDTCTWDMTDSKCVSISRDELKDLLQCSSPPALPPA